MKTAFKKFLFLDHFILMGQYVFNGLHYVYKLTFMPPSDITI